MTSEAGNQPAAWTWADQISSWRFWALVFAYLMAVPLADATLFQSLPFWREIVGINTPEYGALMATRHIASGFGLGLAWVAVRWRPRLSLVLLMALKVVGVVLLFYVNHGPSGPRFVGSTLIGLSTGALVIAVPALIAGGRRGADGFVVSFGILSMLAVVVGFGASYAVGLGVQAWGPWWMAYMASLAALGSVVMASTVGSALFAGPPPARGYTLEPVARGPVPAALLSVIPFYMVYWLYRTHGEVAALAPSRQLLSPRGALWSSILVPFVPLFAIASLMEAMNARCEALGMRRPRSPVTIYLLALFLAPVAVAMVQAGINRLLEERRRDPIAAALPT